MNAPTFEIRLSELIHSDAVVICEMPGGLKSGCSLLAILESFSLAQSEADALKLADVLEDMSRRLREKPELDEMEGKLRSSLALTSAGSPAPPR